MQVEELFQAERLTLEFLEEHADQSPYWESAHRFVSQNWKRDVNQLTVKQVGWLDRIVEDLVEIRIEGRYP